MVDAMVRIRARKLLQLAKVGEAGIDEKKVLEIVRELLHSTIPNRREIAREVGRLAQSTIEAHRAKVVTASALSDRAEKELSVIIRAKFPEVVDFEWSVDPTIVGGVVIKIGDMWYDASIANDLSKIKERLTQ